MYFGGTKGTDVEKEVGVCLWVSRSILQNAAGAGRVVAASLSYLFSFNDTGERINGTN